MKNIAIILSGGSGKRLWPLSRSSYPKQFLALENNQTMLQNTVLRAQACGIESNITICNAENRFIASEQLSEINALDQIILEPEGKNTAPAIAISALIAPKDSILVILSADHAITGEQNFKKAISSAIELAKKDKLVTLACKAEQPHTGYGYIKRGDVYLDGYKVKEFIEKPSKTMAMKFVDDGSYYWNTGIFVFKASKYLEELKEFRPEIYETCVESVNGISLESNYINLNDDSFLNCPNESIDYAVMENTHNACMVPLDSNWSDLGSWNKLWEINVEKDTDNYIEGDVVSIETSGSYIYSDKALVTTVGVKDLVIVSTKDSLLVSSMESSEKVKELVDTLEVTDRKEINTGQEVHRPWGKYDSVDYGQGFQVKRITVNPKAKLSLQKHHKRDEHWIVVSGIARVTKGDETFDLEENESVFIPKEVTHCLENTTNDILQLIEVQIGPYLGEDDIVRYEDIYGRIKEQEK